MVKQNGLRKDSTNREKMGFKLFPQKRKTKQGGIDWKIEFQYEQSAMINLYRCGNFLVVTSGSGIIKIRLTGRSTKTIISVSIAVIKALSPNDGI